MANNTKSIILFDSVFWNKTNFKSFYLINFAEFLSWVVCESIKLIVIEIRETSNQYWFVNVTN